MGGAAGITTLKHHDDKLSTIDLRVDYLAPGKAKDLITEGIVVKSGSRVIFTRMIAYHDDRENLVAETERPGFIDRGRRLRPPSVLVYHRARERSV